MPWRDNSDSGKNYGMPEWYTPEFLAAVDQAVRELGWQLVRWERDGVELTDGEGRKMTYGLDNLFRRSQDVAEPDLPRLVVDFLSRINAAPIPEENLDSSAERLMIRLRPFGPNLSEAEDMMWTLPLEGAGLAVCLVLDSPETMTYVTDKMVQDSDREGDEWLERALANLRDKTPSDFLHCIDRETGIYLGSTGDSYDAARAMLVGEFFPEASLGCLVAVPYRDCLLVQPVHQRIIARMHLIRLVALDHFNTKPYPISDDVFWIRDGVWRKLPIEVKEKQITITPPAEFMEVLDGLMGRDEDSESGSDFSGR